MLPRIPRHRGAAISKDAENEHVQVEQGGGGLVPSNLSVLLEALL